MSIHAQKKGNCQYCSKSVVRLKLHEKKCPHNPKNAHYCKHCGKQMFRKYISEYKTKPFCSKKCGIASRTFTYEDCKKAVSKMKYLNDLQGTSWPSIMRKNGWFEELTSDLIRHYHKVYTEQEVLQEAKKYKTRNDFRVGSPGPYNAAKRLKIMDKAVQHMGKSKIEKQYTKQEILDSARRYKNQRDWVKNESSIYNCAKGYDKPNKSKKDKEFWKKCISHMEYIFKPNGYWTKQGCKEVADKYTDRRIFHKEQYEVYKVIVREGWVDELLSHMIWTTPRGNVKYPDDWVWSLEDAINEAKKYKTRNELQKNNNHLYQWIKKHKWEDKCYHHMRALGYSKRHIYVEEFKNSKTAYVGLSCQVKRRHYAHLGKEKRYGKVFSPVYNYMKKTGEKPKLKILTRRPVNSENAGMVENKYMEKYKDKGWTLLNTAKAGSLGSISKNVFQKNKGKVIYDFR